MPRCLSVARSWSPPVARICLASFFLSSLEGELGNEADVLLSTPFAAAFLLGLDCDSDRWCDFFCGDWL